MARARLRDRHQNNLLKKLQILKDQQFVKDEPAEEEESQPSTSRVKEEPGEPSEDSRPATINTDEDNEAEG
jgi:hypothetical protein